MRNITQFLLMLTLSFYIAFAPAVANADPVTDKIDKLQIDLQKRVGDRWTLSPRNKSVGAGVEVGATQSYPVTATTTATTAAGATTSNTATLTAEKIGSKIFTPTTANIAKRFAGGVATTMVAMALYDLLGKAVDYVMDPANNRVIYKEPADPTQRVATINGVKYYSAQAACDAFGTGETGVVEGAFFACYKNGKKVVEYRAGYDSGTRDVPVSFDTLAQRSKDIANNPNHKDVATAQSGMQTVVNDMITNNEIDNSYFNDADISNDTYNDVTNNYVTNNITNQYPSVSVPTKSEIAQAAANGQSSVTKTTQNPDGSKTTTTTNFTTTNNNTTITNITINNPVSKDNTTTPPASTPTTTPPPKPDPDPKKPFELPAFCDWAKPVCDFIDWYKKDEIPENEQPELLKESPTIDVRGIVLKPYVSFPAACPPDPSWSFLGGTISFPLHIICQSLSMLKFAVLAYAYIRALAIIGGGVTSNG